MTVTVFVSELQFFRIEQEFLWISSVIFHQPFFGILSKSLDTIDVDLPIDESYPVIDFHMMKTR